MLVAGLIALPFASRPLAVWAGNLPPGGQPLADGIAWWDHEMERAGLTAPYDFVHQTVRTWVAANF